MKKSFLDRAAAFAVAFVMMTGVVSPNLVAFVSAEETAPAAAETEGVTAGSENGAGETEPAVTDNMAASGGISVQSDVTVIDSGYCGKTSENEGKNVTWALTSDGVLTISGKGALFPHTSYTNYPWYKYVNSITSAIIEEGITDFGYCLRRNPNLKYVRIPNSVTFIGYLAFEGCTGLESVTLPDSISSIGQCAFSYCKNLTNINIPNSVTSIYDRAFEDCISLTSITIPNSVTKIESYAFSNCKSLTNITLPNNIAQIDQGSFIDCENLKDITIPDSVTYISGSAFENCSNLENISIPNSVTSIGYCAFKNCTSLKNVEFSNNITSIDYEMFENCSSLTNVTIPNSVTSIGQRAFGNCTSLKNVIIPSNVVEIHSSAFKDCSNLKVVFYGTKGTKAERFANTYNIPFRELIDWGNDSEAHTFEGQLEYIGKGHMGTGYDPNSPASYDYYALKLTEKVYVRSHYPLNKDTNILEVDKIYFTSQDLNNIDVSKLINKSVRITGTIFESPDGCAEYVAPSEIMFGEINDIISLEPDVPADPDDPNNPTDPDDPDNPTNPDDPNTPDEPVDEDAAKDYDFTVSIYMKDSKEDIIYNADEKKYNKDSYVLSSNFNSSNGGKSINNLKVVYTIADGFSFSSDGRVNVMNSLINSNYLTDIWEFSNESLTVYPVANVDISELGYFSIIVKLYEGDKLIKNTTQRIPIKVTKTPETNPDITTGIKITKENISDFLDQNGDLVITEGEYRTIGKLSCNNLYVKGGHLSIIGSLNVAGNAEITGGQTEWWNPISQDVCGGILTVYGTLNVNGNMTVGTDSGVLEMTHSKAVVDVIGDFKITANSTIYRSKFTAGVLKIGGSFESSGKDSGNFKASGDHITHFYSNDGFSIKMNTKNKDDDKNSYFNKLTFTDSAVNNFKGELYSFNVKGYFKKNDTQNINYTKGEDLNNLFKDYIEDIDNAQKCLLSSYEELYNGNSVLKNSLNGKLGKYVSKDWINKIAADTEMFFQMSVMNKANDVNFDIGGNKISFRNFSENLVFKDVPFGKKSTVDIYVCLDVTGTGIVNSNASTAAVTWYAAGDEYYISGSAVLTFTAIDSLYSDLYEIYHSQAHEDDYWFWFKKVAEDFLDGMSGITGLDVKNAKTVIKIIDKCYKLAKTGKIENPFEITAENVGAKMKKLTQLMTGDNMLKVLISCPVDVEIRDSANNVVGSIVDNRVIISTSEVTMTAVGDKKYCTFNGQDKYSIKLSATGEGTMDYIIDETNGNATYRRIAFEKLPLSLGTVYAGSVECVSMQPDDSYRLIDNHGNVFNATSDMIDLDGEIEPLLKPNNPTTPIDPTIPTAPPVPTIPTQSAPSSPSFSKEPVTASGKSHTRQKLMLKAETTPNSIKLSWNKISGAKKYTVYIHRNGRYEKLKDTAGTSFVFKNPVHGKTYRFLVRYSANGRLSAEMFSGKVTVTVYLKPVVTAHSGKNSIKLSWKPVSGAEKYAVYRYKNGRGSKIYETENTYAVIKNLKSGAKYSYVVRAYVDGKWTSMTRSDIVAAVTE